MKIYNVGIIGTGQIAGSIDDDRKRKSVWSHAGAYKLCTRTKIVAACDIDHERLESFGKSWKVGRLSIISNTRSVVLTFTLTLILSRRGRGE